MGICLVSERKRKDVAMADSEQDGVLMIYTTQIYTTYVISTHHHSPFMFWSFILVQLADFVFVFPVGLIIGLYTAVAVTNSSEGRPLLVE